MSSSSPGEELSTISLVVEEAGLLLRMAALLAGVWEAGVGEMTWRRITPELSGFGTLMGGDVLGNEEVMVRLFVGSWNAEVSNQGLQHTDEPLRCFQRVEERVWVQQWRLTGCGDVGVG